MESSVIESWNPERRSSIHIGSASISHVSDEKKSAKKDTLAVLADKAHKYTLISHLAGVQNILPLELKCIRRGTLSRRRNPASVKAVQAFFLILVPRDQLPHY
jgi:hypothetical protein